MQEHACGNRRTLEARLVSGLWGRDPPETNRGHRYRFRRRTSHMEEHDQRHADERNQPRRQQERKTAHDVIPILWSRRSVSVSGLLVSISTRRLCSERQATSIACSHSLVACWQRSTTSSLNASRI